MSELRFRGLKATVVVELDGMHGTIRVPVHEATHYDDLGSGYGELRIPIGPPLLQRMYLADREAQARLDS